MAISSFSFRNQTDITTGVRQKGSDLSENNQQERGNASENRADISIRRTVWRSVVAAILLGMVITALYTHSEINGRGEEICLHGSYEGTGFWIYENGRESCWFSVRRLFVMGIFLTIFWSPLTFPLSFLVIFVWRSKKLSRDSETNQRSSAMVDPDT